MAKPLIDLVGRDKSLQREIEDLKRRPFVPPAYMGRVMAHYMALPVLRGFWPMSGGSQNNTVNDFSGNGTQLSQSGGQQFGVYNSIVPYRIMNGAGHMTAVDPFALRIGGTSAWNTPEIPQGITIGCWIRQQALSGATSRGVISKYDSGINQRGYILYVGATDNFPRFGISTDGTVTAHTVVHTDTLGIGSWRFLLAKWDRSDSVDIFIDLSKVSITSGVTAGPIFATTADFYVGAYNAGLSTTRLTADIALAFVLDGALTDAMVEYLYRLTRPLFE